MADAIRARGVLALGRGRNSGVSGELGAAILLIVVPVGFNLAFFELDNVRLPGILREPTDVILRRFQAG